MAFFCLSGDTVFESRVAPLEMEEGPQNLAHSAPHGPYPVACVLLIRTLDGSHCASSDDGSGLLQVHQEVARAGEAAQTVRASGLPV